MLSETGVFEFFAVKAYKISGGKTWPLLTLLITFAAVVRGATSLSRVGLIFSS